MVTDVSRDFLGIQFSAGEFRAGAQKDIIMNFEENFQLHTCMDGMGRGHLLWKMYLLCTYQLY